MRFIAFTLAVYMLIGSLIPRTDFSQLVHIYSVIEHFQEHREEAARAGLELSFFEFAEMHFIEVNSHTHDDPTDHQNLPCQSFHASVLLFSVDVAMDFSVTKLPTILEELAYTNQLHLNGFTRLLIQPPNFV